MTAWKSRTAQPDLPILEKNMGPLFQKHNEVAHLSYILKREHNLSLDFHYFMDHISSIF